MLMDNPEYNVCHCGDSYWQRDTQIPCCAKCEAKAQRTERGAHRIQYYRECTITGCGEHFFTPRPNGKLCPKCQTARWERNEKKKNDKKYGKTSTEFSTPKQATTVETPFVANCVCNVCSKAMMHKPNTTPDHWSNTCSDACSVKFYAQYEAELYQAWVAHLNGIQIARRIERSVIADETGVYYECFDADELVGLKPSMYTEKHAKRVAWSIQHIQDADTDEEQDKRQASYDEAIRTLVARFNAVSIGEDILDVINFRNSRPKGLQAHYLVKLAKGGVNCPENMEYMLSAKDLKENGLTPERFRLIRKYWLEAIAKGMSIEEYKTENGITLWSEWLKRKEAEDEGNA